MKRSLNIITYIAAIFAMGVSALASFMTPQIIRITLDLIISGKSVLQEWVIGAPLLNKVATENPHEVILWACGIILVATVATGLFSYLAKRFSAGAAENVGKGLRDRLYDHIQRLDYQYHSKAKTGDLIQRCTSDVETVRDFLAVQAVEVGRVVFMISLALPMMLSMHKRLTLYSLGLFPITFIFSIIFFSIIQRVFRDMDEAEGEMSTVLQENLTGVRVVRAFGREAWEIEKFDKKNQLLRDKVFRLIMLFAYYWSLTDFLSIAQLGIALVMGSLLVYDGVLTIGQMVFFMTIVGMMLWPVRQLGRILTEAGKARVALKRLREILTMPAEDISANLEPPLYGPVVFRNVRFSYDGKTNALNDISFNVEPGQTVGIIGATGSGKSTLALLLPRLVDYSGGSITINGTELSKINKHYLRKKLAIVLQDVFLFARTIQENIAMPRHDIGQLEIFEAARAAGIHNSIERLEKGYETLLGEKGVNLSGGQKQRISIARALVTNAPILIFDDSLSAVDTETDRYIRRALKEYRQHATTFIISHRISSLADADQILVMEEGRIIERGNHDALIKQNGKYAVLWKSQFKEQLHA